jgi:drug/metabolite transporter (DMT)-like permease
MLLGAVLLYGMNFPVTKYVLEHGLAPLAYAAIRFMSGAVLLSLFTYTREGTVALERRDLPRAVGVAVLGVGLSQITYVYSLEYMAASTAALISGLLPIFTLLIALAVGLDRFSTRLVVSACVSFAGAALVALGSSGPVAADVKGIVFALASTFTWACFTVAAAPLMRAYSPYRLSAFIHVVGSVPLVAVAIAQLLRQDFSVGVFVWLALAYAVVGSLIVGNTLWLAGLKRAGPSRASLFSNLNPFVGALLAILVLSEWITPLQVLGGGAIAVGILLSRRGPTTSPTESRSL